PVYSSYGAIVATFFSFTVNIFLLDYFYPKTRQNTLLALRGILTFYRAKAFLIEGSRSKEK
ncbi:MAG: hypothetical protein N3A69_11560, partial [Leptospiraceae bacterium]|nr:hypothetical protein [Leptospiraceae bacterium]